MKKLKIILVFQIILFSNLFAQSANVTAIINPVTSGTVTGTGPYLIGSTVQLDAIPNIGYNFLNWTNGGVIVSSDSNYSFIVLSDTNFDANFASKKIKIETIAEPAIGGSTSGDGNYSYGDNVFVEAVPSFGYKFVDWTVNNIPVSTDSSYNFIAESNLNLVANFELKTYVIEITAEPSIGGSTSGDGIYDYGDSVTVDAIPAIGYKFVDWTIDNIFISTDSSYTFAVESDLDLVANFVLKTYSVISSVEPINSGNVTGDSIYTHGDSATLTAFPSIGYDFINWTEDDIEVSSDSIYVFTVTEDKNIISNFELKSLIVTTSAEPIEGGTTLGDSTYSFGDLVTVKAVKSEGYTFFNWTENGIEVSTDSNYTFTLTEDRSLVANFIINSYLIITESDPIQGGITSGGGIFDYDSLVTITATSADGYAFSGWTESDTLVSSDSSFTFNCRGNQTFTANFSLNQYNVVTSALPVQGGITSGDSSYAHGAMVTVNANTNMGWKFDYWTDGENIISNDSNYTFVIFEDKVLTANFSKRIYNVALTPNPEDGGLLFGSGNYEYDSLITITATPNIGWNFISWVENDTIISADSVISFKLVKNRNLVGNFVKKIYSITTNTAPSNGGITFGDSLYTHGDLVNISAISDSVNGWDFINWKKNDSIISSQENFSFIASENAELVANFALRTYSLQLSSNPNNAGNANGAGNFVHGDSVTISAEPVAGMLFANWSEGSINVSSDSIYKFEIKDNRNLTANFANELFTIISLPEPAEAGVISGSGSFYYGQEATLIPLANAGWEFVNWTENGNEFSKDSVLTLNIQNNLNLKANFKLINYSINCSVSPANAGFTSGCGLSYYNQEMVLNASANEGWLFINWTENDEVVSTDINYLFIVSENRNLVANFDLISDFEAIGNEEQIPDDFYLSNAYPNPFNPSTKINFGLPEDSSVKILVTNVNGEIVRTIFSDAKLSAGNYSSSFNAENLSSGIYFYIILAQSEISDNNFKKVGKLVLLK